MAAETQILDKASINESNLGESSQLVKGPFWSFLFLPVKILFIQILLPEWWCDLPTDQASADNNYKLGAVEEGGMGHRMKTG